MAKFKHDELVENGNYLTSDFYSAAYARANRHKMLRAEWRGDRCYFVFENTRSLNDTIQNYFDDSGRIAPRIFSDEIKRLKFEMYEAKSKREQPVSRSERERHRPSRFRVH